jgi:hypothetical protein
MGLNDKADSRFWWWFHPRKGIMVAKMLQVVSATAVLLVLTGTPSSAEDSQSKSSFSFFHKEKTPTSYVVGKTPPNQDESMLGKIGTGTKNFFSKTGETLGLKKPAPKKPQYTSATVRRASPPKKESKSWMPSIFSSEDKEKKPKAVTDWMKQPRQELR